MTPGAATPGLAAATGSGPAHTANLLGALSLAVGDRTAEAIAAAAGQAASGAAALSALLQFLGRRLAPTVDVLGQVLGLTSSGAVRLVDRLQAAGLVTRAAGRDGRETHVQLTAAGRRAAARVTAARAEVTTAALAPLTDLERATLDRLLGKVLAGMVRAPGATRWTCRLCDTGACGRDAGTCPVANEGARRYG